MHRFPSTFRPPVNSSPPPTWTLKLFSSGQTRLSSNRLSSRKSLKRQARSICPSASPLPLKNTPTRTSTREERMSKRRKMRRHPSYHLSSRNWISWSITKWNSRNLGLFKIHILWELNLTNLKSVIQYNLLRILSINMKKNILIWKYSAAER